MAKNIEFCKKSQKKLQIFKKSLKKVLTLILMCGILTMQSPKGVAIVTEVTTSTMTTTYFD